MMNWTYFPISTSTYFTKGMGDWMAELYDKLEEIRDAANDSIPGWVITGWKTTLTGYMNSAISRKCFKAAPPTAVTCVGKFRQAIDYLAAHILLPNDYDGFSTLDSGFSWSTGYPFMCDISGYINELYTAIDYIADNIHVYIAEDTVTATPTWYTSGGIKLGEDGFFFEEKDTWLDTIASVTDKARELFDTSEPTSDTTHPAYPGPFVGMATWLRDAIWASGVYYFNVFSYVATNSGTKVYVCTSSHTSSSSTEPGVGASWTSYWALVYEYGWSSSTAYNTSGPMIVHNGVRYSCISNHTSDSSNEPGAGASWTTYWSEDEDLTDTIFESSWPDEYWRAPYDNEDGHVQWQTGDWYGYDMSGWAAKLKSTDSIYLFAYDKSGTNYAFGSASAACHGMLTVPVYVNDTKVGDFNPDEDRNIRDIAVQLISGSWSTTGENIVQVMPKFSEMKAAIFLPPDTPADITGVWAANTTYDKDEPADTVVKTSGDSTGYECIQDHTSGGFPAWVAGTSYTLCQRVASDHNEGSGDPDYHAYKCKVASVTSTAAWPHNNPTEWELDDDEPGVGNNWEDYWKTINTYGWDRDTNTDYFWRLPYYKMLIVHPIFD